jgi:hypothetical protein
MRQGHDLRYVSRVFEDDHVMGIETYGSMVFSSMKQILNYVHDTDVSVVTPLRKQRSYSLIRFVHKGNNKITELRTILQRDTRLPHRLITFFFA